MTVYFAKTFHRVFTAVDRVRITARLLYDNKIFCTMLFSIDVYWNAPLWNWRNCLLGVFKCSSKIILCYAPINVKPLGGRPGKGGGFDSSHRPVVMTFDRFYGLCSNSLLTFSCSFDNPQMPCGGAFEEKHSAQFKCSAYARPPPDSSLTLIGALLSHSLLLDKRWFIWQTRHICRSHAPKSWKYCVRLGLIFRRHCHTWDM